MEEFNTVHKQMYKNINFHSDATPSHYKIHYYWNWLHSLSHNRPPAYFGLPQQSLMLPHKKKY